MRARPFRSAVAALEWARPIVVAASGSGIRRRKAESAAPRSSFVMGQGSRARSTFTQEGDAAAVGAKYGVAVGELAGLGGYQQYQPSVGTKAGVILRNFHQLAFM